MLSKPMDVLDQFPVRKTKKQKKAFRDAVCEYAGSMGYPVKVEKGSFGCHNVVMGDPEKAKFLITAHYDTCARLPFPNLITPCNFWLYLLYQLAITILLLGFPFVPAVIAGLLGANGDVSYLIWYYTLIAEIILMYAGPANPRNANDNTSGVVTVLEIAQNLPETRRSEVCFVLFDLEEAGLIGSSAYYSAHKKQAREQLILNLDCVGEGDDIVLFPGKKVRKSEKWMQLLRSVNVSGGEKRLTVREKGFSFYPSDQANFPYGVGIAALCRSRLGLYLGKIHTPRDTVLDERNVKLLRDSLIAVIGSASKEERNEEYETV